LFLLGVFFLFNAFDSFWIIFGVTLTLPHDIFWSLWAKVFISFVRVKLNFRLCLISLALNLHRYPCFAFEWFFLKSVNTFFLMFSHHLNVLSLWSYTIMRFVIV
jgi:hypothetical protein